MRAFVAIEVPEAVKMEIGRRLDSLRADFPPARWVAPENYHLTLFFLGNLEVSQVRRLGAKLAAVFDGASRMRLRLEGAGCFPPRGRARVIWIGLAPQPRLAELAARVATVCSRELEQQPDERPYRPHLTVARCRQPWPRKTAERMAERLRAFQTNELAVDRGVLMESRGGSYRVVSAFPLGA